MIYFVKKFMYTVVANAKEFDKIKHARYDVVFRGVSQQSRCRLLVETQPQHHQQGHNRAEVAFPFRLRSTKRKIEAVLKIVIIHFVEYPVKLLRFRRETGRMI